MSLISAEITQAAAAVATSTYRPGDDLLDSVLAALPPLIADAPLAWHRTHRTWAAKGIAAFRPADVVEAMFVGQIVVLRHLGASLTSRASVHANSPMQARRLDRCAVAMMRAGAGLERGLRRQQRSAVPPGGEWAAEGFDLVAMEAFWRGMPEGEAGAAPSPPLRRAERPPDQASRRVKMPRGRLQWGCLGPLLAGQAREAAEVRKGGDGSGRVISCGKKSPACVGEGPMQPATAREPARRIDPVGSRPRAPGNRP
jgi:hypothetical protein